MDGNRRWAKQKGKHALAGHQYVVDVLLEELIEHAAEKGVQYVTLWAWSTENWERPPQEVKGVMTLFKHVLGRSVQKLHKNGVRLQAIGDIAGFPQDIAKGIADAVERTKDNKKITVILALNYGGRDEITRAINKVIRHQASTFAKATADKSGMRPEEIDPSLTLHLPRGGKGEVVSKEEFSNYLDTKDIPDPELIIRTGGDKRLSGFLLWQSEYAELYFTDTLMPDFTPQELDKALEEFARRDRRFGK